MLSHSDLFITEKLPQSRFYIFPLVLGFFLSQKIVVGGEIYLGEIFSLLYLIFARGSSVLRSKFFYFIFFATLWIISQISSDLINSTLLVDSIKGVGAPLLLISTSYAFCLYFYFNRRKLPSFLIGLSLGSILQFFLLPSIYFNENPWKWGVGGLVLDIFVIYFTFYSKTQKIFHLFLFAFIYLIFSLINDARSLGIFPLFAVFAFYLFNGRLSNLRTSLSKKYGVVKIFIFTILLIFFINMSVSSVFSSNWFLNFFSQESALKYGRQASGEFGILLGGRTEYFSSIRAFLDAPFFGHGSWAIDSGKYLNIKETKLLDFGYIDDYSISLNEKLIPTHSYLMSALVWAGIGGGIFWVYIVYKMLSTFVNFNGNLGFYFYMGLISLMWNILFSPFGATARFSTAIFLSVVFFMYVNIKNKIYK